MFHALTVINTYIVNSYYATFTNKLEGFLIVIIIVGLVCIDKYKVIGFSFTSLKELICKEAKTRTGCSYIQLRLKE